MVIGQLGLKATVAEKWWHDSYLSALSFGDGVSVQGVESLWGDCRFILADWGS